jgi:hypothetical protein
MGVKEGFRNKGVDVTLYWALMDSVVKSGYVHSDSGWVLETNRNASSVTINAGGKVYKVYRYFEKALEPATGE